MRKTRVVHCKKEPYDVYIGRGPGSKWGNPFVIGKDGDRKEVISKYIAYFWSEPNLFEHTSELKGKVLGCWCKPRACHGDFLADVADHEGEYKGF